MKRITTTFLIVLSGHLSMIAQTDTTAYGIVKNMPVFYEQLKQQLTYLADFASRPYRLCHDGNRYRTAQRIQGSKNTI